MSRLEIILSASLVVSLIFNVGLAVFTRAAIIRLLSISEELGDLQNMINSFTRHLDDIYSLEMFYGDEVINSLLDHASSFSEQMETFEYIYTLTEADRLNSEQAEVDEEKEPDDDTDPEAT